MDFIIAALQLTPALARAGENLDLFVEWSIAAFDRDGGPTDADWDTLQAREADLRAKLAPVRS